MNKVIGILIILIICISAYFLFFSRETSIQTITETSSISPTTSENNSPMNIQALRNREYPGSDLKIEETLAPGSNYNQYVASYMSDGLKLYGLLTVPNTAKPEKGFPTIVFMHGYIDPKVYSTTENYKLYQAMLAREEFITFKPDLRGHDKSEGQAESAHFSEVYVVDNLNTISSLKKYKDVDPNRIGYWGHSNGGEIGLRSLVISKDIKAASLWAGVVGSFPDMLETYNSKIPFLQTKSNLENEYGKPSENPEFWKTIDPYSYLQDISTPIELQHGTADSSVPVELSQRLDEELKKLNKPVTLYVYQGDDHNIAQNFSLAWQRTVAFFKKNL